MSRIGILPIAIPEGVTINVDENNLVSVKGPLGELSQQVNEAITLKIENQDGLAFALNPQSSIRNPKFDFKRLMVRLNRNKEK